MASNVAQSVLKLSDPGFDVQYFQDFDIDETALKQSIPKMSKCGPSNEAIPLKHLLFIKEKFVK